MTKTEPRIFHADVWGMRTQKYHVLLEAALDNVPWKVLEPAQPFYLFIPQNEGLREEYERGLKVTEIFPVNSVGIVTADDGTLIGFTEQELKRQIEKKFSIYEQNKKKQIYYHPFDSRFIYFDTEKIERAREKVMHHMLAGKNVGIITTRLTKDAWSALATDSIIAHKSGSRYDISYLFPLYLYPPSEGQKKPKSGWFEEDDAFQGQERVENLSKEFRGFVDKKYRHHYSPEEILGYIYAVLHSPTYRATYHEFLKIDFPRIPFVDNQETFETLSKLGWALLQAHVLKTIPAEPKVDVTKGSFVVEKPVYEDKQQGLYINTEQYFSPVPRDVWEFQIGGYQVLDKYLKSRKGRTLILDEIEHIQNVVQILTFTIQQMQKIDECWQP
jgi:predicted helicase